MHRRKLLEGLRAYRVDNLEELQLVDRFDSVSYTHLTLPTIYSV